MVNKGRWGWREPTKTWSDYKPTTGWLCAASGWDEAAWRCELGESKESPTIYLLTGAATQSQWLSERCWEALIFTVWSSVRGCGLRIEVSSRPQSYRLALKASNIQSIGPFDLWLSNVVVWTITSRETTLVRLRFIKKTKGKKSKRLC